MDCTSRMNERNEVIFLYAGANSGKLEVISLIFEWVWSEMGVATYLVYKTLISDVIRMSVGIELIFCMLTVIE